MRKPNEKIREILGECYEELILVEGHDNAILGVADGCGLPSRVVYDRRKVLHNLVRDGIGSHEDAEEFFEYNILGSFVGETTPLFFTRIDDLI